MKSDKLMYLIKDRFMSTYLLLVTLVPFLTKVFEL